MRNYKILILIPLLLLLHGVFSNSLAQIKGIQPSDEVLIQAKWQSELDAKSFWEFKNDGKVYASYLGSDVVQISRYIITSTPPLCQEGVSLAIEKNVKFLQLTHEKYGSISCFYIYGLNAERLTVMDALTGHIFPMIKAED